MNDLDFRILSYREVRGIVKTVHFRLLFCNISIEVIKFKIYSLEK